MIRLLAAGHTSKLIASALGITKNTVENHRQRLLKKAGCYTSSELTAYAVNHGLI
ncbi:response regulator transcription factor [Parapedobacter sp. GCM10030251]|uniref:response regulator transcription factor n=1 Tax=Parapedobacter sp. GCM10030251 TaxID=3273419 RepID=UPI00361BF413